MRKLLLLVLFLAACSSQKDQILTEEEQNENEQKTINCFHNPELWGVWGECNVRKTIYDRLPKVRGCYEKQKNYTYEGDILLKIHVRTNGRVREIQIAEGSLKNKMLSTCLLTELQKARFAKPPKNITPIVYFPFSFEALKEAPKP